MAFNFLYSVDICINDYRKSIEINNCHFKSTFFKFSSLCLKPFTDSPATLLHTKPDILLNILYTCMYTYTYVYVYTYGCVHTHRVMCDNLWDNEWRCRCWKCWIRWKKQEFCWFVYGPLIGSEWDRYTHKPERDR